MGQLYKSYRIRLEPNNKQETLFKKHAGCARYAYNWAVDMSEFIYGETGKSLTAIDFHKMFVALEKSKNEWLYEVSKSATQQALRNFESAQKKFHSLQKKSNYGEKKMLKKKGADGKNLWILKGLPQKKKKGKSGDNFYLEKDGVKPLDTSVFRINLPKIGWVKCSEILPQWVNIKNCAISRHADNWFISFKSEIEPTTHKNQGRVGVDLGIKKFATCSNGVVFESPKRYKELDKKLKREQRKLARMYESWKKENGDRTGANTLQKSNNFEKQKRKIANLHKRIVDHRRDALHKATTYLTKNNSQVVIEDLNVSGMLKNSNLSRSIANGGWYEFRRQLEYKGAWYGCEIIIAGKFFASSKMCNKCKHIKKDLKLSDRIWTCENCGETHERDKNASDNLHDFPIGGYAASCAVKACGEGSSDCGRSLSEKQETNIWAALVQV